MAERTIHVTGKGMLRLAPDLIGLTLAASASDADYAQAVQTAEQSAACIAQTIAKTIGPDHIRSAGVRVEPRYESVTENGVQTRRRTGYTATHRLKAEFSADPALFADVLKALSDSGADPELSVEYTLSHAEKARRRAAALAVRDAKKRAEALAAAAGVKLGSVRTVESGGHGAFPAVRAMAMRANDLSELAPEEIEIAEEVTVVFDID